MHELVLWNGPNYITTTEEKIAEIRQLVYSDRNSRSEKGELHIFCGSWRNLEDSQVRFAYYIATDCPGDLRESFLATAQR